VVHQRQSMDSINHMHLCYRDYFKRDKIYICTVVCMYIVYGNVDL